MASYDIFSKYFDDLMIDPIKKTKRIETYIKSRLPSAKTVLDIGCGTGSILNNLPRKYSKTGIDLSIKMLKIAKIKVKQAQFYQKNMNSFKLYKKFDIILCIYDSINHLLEFKDWKHFFKNVNQHLNENGLFIFDVNTPYRLEELSKSQPQVKWFGNKNQNLSSLSVSKDKGNIYNWSVKIFEIQKRNQYLLFEETIKESCFSTKKIQAALGKEFITIFVESDEKTKPTSKSGRVWFVCQGPKVNK